MNLIVSTVHQYPWERVTDEVWSKFNRTWSLINLRWRIERPVYEIRNAINEPLDLIRFDET